MNLIDGYSFFSVSNWPTFCGSIALIVTAVFLSRRLTVSRGPALLCAGLVLAASLLNIFYYLADTFTGAGINAAVWFHLFSAFNTIGLTAFIAFIGVGAVLFLVSIGAAVYVYRAAVHSSDDSQDVGSGPQIVLAVLLLAACAVSPASVDIWGHLKSLEPIEEIPQYETPTIGVHAGDPPNLVYIYAESLEQTFLNEALFPGLAPGLKALQARSTVFTDIRQVWGTEWSVAGIVASHCGVPLAGPDEFWTWENRLSLDTPDFYSGATCLGDLLTSRGYDLSFISGADLKFHGIAEFLKTHRIHVIDLWSESLERLLGKNVRSFPWSAWGIFDDVLFDVSAKLISQLAAKESPFGVFIETADTHNPAGHLTPSCKDIKYGDGSEQLLNSVACADHLITRFITAAERDPAYKNTVIVVASDHFMQRNSVTPRLKTVHRSNLFMVYDLRSPEPRRIEKTGSMLDVGPTLLGIFGFQNQLALGRDLLRDRPSLMTEIDDLNHMLGVWKPYFSKLWEHPVVDRDITFKLSDSAMVIGAKTVRYPVLLTLDETLQTSVFKPQEKALVKGILKQVYEQKKKTKSPFIWADRCDLLASMGDSVSGTRPVRLSDAQFKSGHCVVVGVAGQSDHHLEPITDDTTLGLDTLYTVFKFPALKALKAGQ